MSKETSAKVVLLLQLLDEEDDQQPGQEAPQIDVLDCAPKSEG